MSKKIHILVSSLLLTTSSYALAVESLNIKEGSLDLKSSVSSLRAYTDRILSDEATLHAADRKRTELIFVNDGVYSSRYRVEYCASDGMGEQMKFHQTSGNVMGGGRKKIYLPADAFHVKVTAQYDTGVLWAKWKNIYQIDICANVNEWSYIDDINVMQINNWGSVFNRSWSVMTPSVPVLVLIRNKNANPDLGCNFP